MSKPSQPTLFDLLLSTIFVGLVVSRVLYALPAWGVFASVGQSGRIDAFLKRAYKFGFSKDIIIFNELLTKSCSSVFLKMQSSVHCLNYLLPPKKVTSYKLRNSDCSYVLPECNSSVFKRSFINCPISLMQRTFDGPAPAAMLAPSWLASRGPL